jgi:hypothetical protein
VLEEFSDTALAQLVRFADREIEKRRNQLEDVVASQNINKSYFLVGSIQELRHLTALANSILRSRAKGQS